MAKDQLRYCHFYTDFKSDEPQFQWLFRSLKFLKGPEAIRSLLSIGADGMVYRLERWSLNDGVPVIYMISCLPKELFPGLEKFPKTHFEKIPLYTLIEKK